MKNFWILSALLLLWCMQVKAQDSLTIYQVYPSFNDQEKAEWTAFQNDWNFFDYAALKKKHHIKTMSCRKCEGFYADIYVEIGGTGNVVKATALRASRCGRSTTDKLLYSDFENSVSMHHFKTLRHKRFIARFGLVLKC